MHTSLGGVSTCVLSLLIAPTRVCIALSSLEQAFSSAGCIEYGAVGDKFDPSAHEALYEFDDLTKEPTTIGQLMKSGFKMHDRA